MLGYKVRCRYLLGMINFLNALVIVFDIPSASSFISIIFISAISAPFS